MVTNKEIGDIALRYFKKPIAFWKQATIILSVINFLFLYVIIWRMLISQKDTNFIKYAIDYDATLRGLIIADIVTSGIFVLLFWLFYSEDMWYHKKAKALKNDDDSLTKYIMLK